MRTILFTSVIAVVLGFAGLATSSAAPINYTPIPSAANSSSNPIVKAWWDRGRWCSRRCNWRRCWIVCR